MSDQDVYLYLAQTTGGRFNYLPPFLWINTMADLDFNIDFDFPLEKYARRAANALLAEQLQELFNDSFAAFVIVAADASLINTGMSRASFIPLGSRLGIGREVKNDIQSDRKTISRKGYGNPWQPGVVSDFANGIRLGQAAYTLSLGQKTKHQYELTFDMSVFQHQFHADKNNAKALEAGAAAFEQHFAQNFSKIVSQDLIDLFLN